MSSVILTLTFKLRIKAYFHVFNNVILYNTFLKEETNNNWIKEID